METDDRKTTTVYDYVLSRADFFEDDEDRSDFEKKFTRLTEDKKMMLLKTTHDFYLQAWEEGGENEPILENFFTKSIYSCKSENVVLDFYQWKRIHGIDNAQVKNQPRLVDVDFQIKNTKLSHQYDGCSRTHQE